MVELFVSNETLDELRRVLDYPAVRSISPQLTDEHVDRFLKHLAFRATRVRRVPKRFHLPRDPDDEAYLNLAAAAAADFLVSRDKDLLSLMTARSIVAKQFRQRTRPLMVLDPVAFLEAVGSGNPTP